jgi:hypothetical protein
LTADEASLKDYSELTWPEQIAADQSGDAHYDVTLDLDQDQRDGNYATQSDVLSTCDLVYIDACSGRLGLVCTSRDTTSSSPATERTVELVLAEP